MAIAFIDQRKEQWKVFRCLLLPFLLDNRRSSEDLANGQCLASWRSTAFASDFDSEASFLPSMRRFRLFGSSRFEFRCSEFADSVLRSFPTAGFIGFHLFGNVFE